MFKKNFRKNENNRESIFLNKKNKEKNVGNKFQKIEKHNIWLKKNKSKIKLEKELNNKSTLSVGCRVRAKKSLGQNFLHDYSVVENICKSVDILGKTIIEIGPGTGFLTKEILKYNPKKLILIEKDINLFQNLNKIFINEINEKKIDIINIDALKIDFQKIKQNFKKITIISNLPYNIGTTLVIDWMKQLDIIENIVVMLQKEVVDRIAALPKTKDYGRISVLVQSRCFVEKLFNVLPECFHPKPKVMSSVIKISPKNINYNIDFDILDKILKLAFNQRRKKMSNIFKNTDFMDRIKNFNEKRPEEITVEEYLSI